ncbi:uncharacterized protein LOC132199416 isoform X2 [Neocloeon triangulifer]|uniref:uncharacterized protein LOC132199416 isoform X2 n=1 Tax=Neocloeon triangulifer TaxID=2078957 RepID=UPI00286F2C4A|nr:uncharacterized protein LOC132199416 isoform X2 [Neocloeon triangulifer]
MCTKKIMVLACLLALCLAYDPEDEQLAKVLLPKDKFEAFYPNRAYGVVNGDARPAHGHGSFYKHRHPALIDVKNAPAYGFRFDGKRRFNFD